MSKARKNSLQRRKLEFENKQRAVSRKSGRRSLRRQQKTQT